MPSQYHSRKSSPRTLLGGPRAQGCSRRQAEASGAQPQLLPCPGDSWEHQEQGCGHGALALKQRNPDVSRGTSSSLCPTAGHPMLWKLFPWCGRAELQGPASDHSRSFLPRSVFLPCLWPFCPGAGGGMLPMFGFSSLLQPKQRVLRASCHPLVVPVAPEPPKLMQSPPPVQRGARLPLASLFLRFFFLDNVDITSGARKWLHVLPPDTAGPSARSCCVGFATELLPEDDPSLSGEVGIAATSPEEVQQLPWIPWEGPQPPASPALPFSPFLPPCP